MTVTSWLVDLMPERRGWRLALGIGMVVLGILALAYAPAAGIVSTVLLALALVIGGGVALIGVFRSEGLAETLMMILLAAMLVFTGGWLLVDPVSALVAVTTLVGTYLFLSGMARIVIALFDRRGRWAWAALHGVVNLLLGVLIFANWPLSGLVAVGLFIGLELIFVGISWIVGRRATPDEPSTQDRHAKRGRNARRDRRHARAARRG